MAQPFRLATEVVFGVGVALRAGDVARRLGGRRVLLVTDPGLVRSGHVEPVEAALEAAGLAVVRFEEVAENPTSAHVEACVAAAAGFEPDLILGLGGGSPIDVAKAANLILTNGGAPGDYRGHGEAPRPLLPLIAVPTTAGTGSETQSFALITDPQSHQKMALGDVAAAPRVALLDPALSVTLPRFVTACTGLDAIGHAVECAVTRIRSETSARLAAEAFGLAAKALPRVLERPDDLEARGHMLRAAALAGIAIENSMLGAAHSMANPLTAHHGLAHGQAVGLCLPHVVRFNAADEGARAGYEALADSPEALAEQLEALLDAAQVAASLTTPLDVPAMAAEAAVQWTAGFNPRPVGEAEFEDLFTALGDSRHLG